MKDMESVKKDIYAMHKRREMMTDRRRYIIYYTFGEKPQTAPAENEPVDEAPAPKTVNSD